MPLSLETASLSSSLMVGVSIFDVIFIIIIISMTIIIVIMNLFIYCFTYLFWCLVSSSLAWPSATVSSTRRKTTKPFLVSRIVPVIATTPSFTTVADWKVRHNDLCHIFTLVTVDYNTTAVCHCHKYLNQCSTAFKCKLHCHSLIDLQQCQITIEMQDSDLTFSSNPFLMRCLSATP